MKPKKPIESLIVNLRGQKVILDADLAEIYGVPTKRLNEQVKRNADRFPEDFLFQLTLEEAEEMQRSKSQIATASRAAAPMRSQIATASKRNIRHRPHAFTEHGAIMAATIRCGIFPSVVQGWPAGRGLSRGAGEKRHAACDKSIKTGLFSFSSRDKAVTSRDKWKWEDVEA